MTQQATERNSTTNATDSYNGRDHKLSLIDASLDQAKVMRKVKDLMDTPDYPANLIGAFAPELKDADEYGHLNLIFQHHVSSTTLTNLENCVERGIGLESTIRAKPCKDTNQLQIEIQWNREALL
mgnify:CR=1 FL=1